MNKHRIIEMIQASGNMPDIPRDFGEILKMLLKPAEYDMDLCVESFSRFPQLEANLIQVLNYSSNLNREIRTIKEAINYLGAQRARIISIAFVTRLLLPDNKGRARLFNNKTYWKHNLGTSIAAYIIAEKTNYSDKDKILTYGLIHDIGITALDICLPEEIDKVHELHQKGVHQIVAEKIILGGITHADIGLWICKEWGLPDEIAEVVGYHHTPSLAKKYVDDVNIMHLADSISTNYYEKLLGNHTTFIYADKIMEKYNIDKEFIDSIINKLPSEVDKLNRRFKL
ncbi:MAG: HDOD domain-containing protein [Clostridiales bacterium]|jgi:HD-like signal output (HDOD) protein|nr:HDOD domain-containing protein [Clostridiales bacterium]